MNKTQITTQTMPQTITAQIVSGFVANGAGGNPAGVVLDADKLNESEMLRIAANIGLSETAFVSSSETEGFKLDFFTPNRRIAHCGHATIAAFSYLTELVKGRRLKKQLMVRVKYQLKMAQPLWSKSRLNIEC
ncbi:PhzF family phenazine biosynthesis isomerase [Pseudomonas sp. HK3]